MATVIDLTEAEYPAAHNGHSILPPEGTSLRPAFEDKSLDRDTLFWEHEGNAAIRKGDWKLVRAGGKGAWELYNLKTDRTEQHDLASGHPARVRDLAAEWRAWAERCNVSPNGLPKKPAGSKKSQKK